MTTADLEARIKALEKEVTLARDIQQIERLQRAYGYFLEHWMYEDVIDLFSDHPDVILEWPEGTYYGKEGVRRYYDRSDRPYDRFMSHQMMQVSPITTVAEDGKRAEARWYCFGFMGGLREGKPMQRFICGIYENKYIKEDGIWKILAFRWCPEYTTVNTPEGLMFCPPEECETTEPRPAAMGGYAPADDMPIPITGHEKAYPSGWIFPFHFKNPVTGKKTTEDWRNEHAVFNPNRVRLSPMREKK